MGSSVWTAGSSEGYRIGRERDDNDPHPIQIPKNSYIKTISCSWKNGYFATDENHFYSWGTGQNYRLGTGVRNDSPFPQRVGTFPNNFAFRLVVSGDQFAATLGEDGTVMAWGNYFFQAPTIINLPAKAVHIAAGANRLICALENGSCTVVRDSHAIQTIKIPEAMIVKVAAGTSHFLALSDDGVAYSWGDSAATGHPNEVSTPKVVPSLPHTIQSVFAYHNNSWFLNIDGSLYFCGANIEGSLGNGSISPSRIVSRHPHSFGDAPVIQVGCGDDFTLVLNSIGEVYAAGNPADGRTMVSDTNLHYEFQLCTKLANLNVTQISCGSYSSAVLVDGAPPPDLGIVLLRNFQDYKIPSNPVSVIGPNSERIMLEPCEDFLYQLGLMRGDILADTRLNVENQCMVIGGNENRALVILERDCKIVFLDASNHEEMTSNFLLVRRNGSCLVQGVTISQKSLTIDGSSKAFERLNGLHVGDIIDGGLVIAGALGPHVYGIKQGFFEPVSVEKIECVKRQGECIERRILHNGELCFAQISNKKGDVYMHRQFGACVFVGSFLESRCFANPADFGRIRVIEDDCDLVRTVTDKQTHLYYLGSMEPIDVLISATETIDYGFIPLDVVQTIKGKGSVLGVYENQIVVLLERNTQSFGTVTLFSPKELTTIARVSHQCTVEYQDIILSINTDDFTQKMYLPADEVKYKGNVCIIAGIDFNNYGYVNLNGRIIRIENDDDVDVCFRHLHVYCNKVFNDISISISMCSYFMSLILPLDTVIINEEECTFVGYTIDYEPKPVYVSKDAGDLISHKVLPLSTSIVK